MNRKLLSKAVGDIDPDFIAEAYRPETAGSSNIPERIQPMKTKRLISLALAAALVLALGVAAYAADLFGVRAIKITTGRLAATDAPGGYVSITQPQDVPEELDTSIREKIDRSAAAWAEWEAWRRDNGVGITEPESCKAPENTSTSTVEENEDGTLTMIFYSDANSETEIERRVVSAEEYKQFEEYWEIMSRGYPGYDFKYGVYTKEMADKLEEIAASYGLKLRHRSTVRFQNFGDQQGYLSREELTEQVNKVCAGGKSFFRTEPTGYDKFYYYDEGTFAVSFYTTEDFTLDGTTCYLYNSPYGTLSSGYEVVGLVDDFSVVSPRTHTAPDGTEVTVLQGGREVYAYTYLPDSFVTLTIHQAGGLTEEEIDAVIDMVDFSAME